MSAAVRAMPVRGDVLGSVTFPPKLTIWETSVPTAPVGATASSITEVRVTAVSARVGAVLRLP